MKDIHVLPEQPKPTKKEHPERREEDSSVFKWLPKSIMAWGLTTQFSIIIVLGAAWLNAESQWRAQREASDKANSDAQAQVMQRLVAAEVDLRAVKEWNALREAADARRDQRIDKVIDRLDEITKKVLVMLPRENH